jgi:ABC-type dipeptide/oligopeptide/nickel transport system permease component
VQSFFLWPGLSLSILQAFFLDMPFLITYLVFALGFMYLLLIAAFDFAYLMLNIRLAGKQQVQQDSGNY